MNVAQIELLRTRRFRFSAEQTMSRVQTNDSSCRISTRRSKCPEPDPAVPTAVPTATLQIVVVHIRSSLIASSNDHRRLTAAIQHFAIHRSQRRHVPGSPSPAIGTKRAEPAIETAYRSLTTDLLRALQHTVSPTYHGSRARHDILYRCQQVGTEPSAAGFLMCPRSR